MASIGLVDSGATIGATKIKTLQERVDELHRARTEEKARKEADQHRLYELADLRAQDFGDFIAKRGLARASGISIGRDRAAVAMTINGNSISVEICNFDQFVVASPALHLGEPGGTPCSEDEMLEFVYKFVERNTSSPAT